MSRCRRRIRRFGITAIRTAASARPVRRAIVSVSMHSQRQRTPAALARDRINIRLSHRRICLSLRMKHPRKICRVGDQRGVRAVGTGWGVGGVGTIAGEEPDRRISIVWERGARFTIAVTVEAGLPRVDVEDA